MQNNFSFSQHKKMLYITLSALLVLSIAFATVFVLSRVSEPASEQEPGDVPLQQKLAELYKSSGSNIDQNVTLDTPVVQVSGTEGYSNAHAKILKADSDDTEIAYFYQTPDETWYFFVSAPDQDKLSCSEYNTEDLINAFVGFTCEGADGSSYVQHEQPEFEVVPGSIGG